MTRALVPVKRLDAAKSRLGNALSRERVEALSLAMLADVVEALRGAHPVSEVVVVTPDARVAEAARARGASVHGGPDPGLNPALDAAAAALDPDAREPLLVMLGDVVGALSGEIEALFEGLAALGARGAVLAPSADGGTSALLRAPRDVLPSLFGPESARAHRDEAVRTGVPWKELPLASLRLDCDRPEDLARIRALPEGAPHTRALLEEWDA